MTHTEPAVISGEFVWPYRVRFSDCDPAGIVFYPHYFVLTNSVVEDWWRHIGHPWTQTLTHQGMGTPLADMHSRFLRPSQMGDALQFRLRVTKVGNSSLELAHRVLGEDGQVRLEIEQRLVCTSLQTHRPIPWPSEIRAAIVQFKGNT
jgi:4-hydroxybenzoyl-CoA thioesterase